jgi:ubiquinone/menaquinone biosynthesis C-methylase UbiE
MSDDVTDIKQYYSKNNEVVRHEQQQIEFELATRIFKAEIKPSGKLLELGCGAGFYSLFFASLGVEVEALDFTPKLIEEANAILASTNFKDRINFQVGDARNLSQFSENQFDYVVSMGPMYHLVDAKDRMAHLKESHRVLKDKGKLFVVYLSRIGYLNYILFKNPKLILTDPHQIEDVMNNGLFKNHPKDGNFRGFFTDSNHVHKELDLAELKYLRTWTLDPGVGAIDEIFNRLSDEEKKAWADLYFKYADHPDFIGSGRTILVMAEKK